MVDLDPGTFRHRVAIQAAIRTTDSEGGFAEEWVTVETVWAAVRPMRAQQIAEYKSLNVHATHLIEMRAASPVAEGDRLLFGAREFEVCTVENEREAGVKKWVTCKERRA